MPATRSNRVSSQQLMLQKSPKKEGLRSPTRANRIAGIWKESIQNDSNAPVAVDDSLIKEREALAPYSSNTPPPSVTSVSELSEKYEALLKLRTTDAEDMLRKYQSSVESQLESSQTLVSRLVEENNHMSLETTRLRQEMYELKEKLQTVERANEKLVDKVDSLETENKSLSKQMSIFLGGGSDSNQRVDNQKSLEYSFLRDICGVEYQIESEEGGIVIHCLQKGKKGSFNYDLYISDDAPSVYSYYPPEDREMLDLIPKEHDYLSSDAEFPRSLAYQLPPKISRIIQQ